MQVGFIGLGTMGASMAANLQKAGYKLVVNDVRRQAASTHIAAGAQWVATPREVAAACEVIFTSLPGPPEVESVALGTDGLIEGIAKDAVRGTLSVDDDLLLERAAQGQDLAVGLLATNGTGDESNEVEAKFTVRLGAPQ